ncbi:MAG: putative Metallo-dependent hydrolase [Candidatus Parcubacteria bacterium]|jgi:cytosine/adenosine deaminase-related metal-dependent hydrolase
MGFLTEIRVRIGPFEQKLLAAIAKLGGGRNFHAHFDRSGTLDPEYLEGFDTHPLEAASVMSLRRKQVLTGELHRNCGYQDEENLEARIRECLDDADAQGLIEAISCIDATPDIGLTAIRVAARLREEYRGKVDFKIAAHPIFGFKDDPDHESTRWDVFLEACRIADIVGSLPEKDDRSDSIGYDEHLRRTLKLAITLRKPFHAHVDQSNLPTERGTLTLIQAVRWLGSPILPDVSRADTHVPSVWAIHAISPSSYPEELFREVIEGLVKHRIGVIVCPSAALSMRQRHDVLVPMHNSIARVLEMALAGVEIRIGTDNLADVFVPTNVTLLGELMTLANALRFYDIPVLAKMATGTKLNATNKDAIRTHLEAARG